MADNLIIPNIPQDANVWLLEGHDDGFAVYRNGELVFTATPDDLATLALMFQDALMMEEDEDDKLTQNDRLEED